MIFLDSKGRNVTKSMWKFYKEIDNPNIIGHKKCEVEGCNGELIYTGRVEQEGYYIHKCNKCGYIRVFCGINFPIKLHFTKEEGITLKFGHVFK